MTDCIIQTKQVTKQFGGLTAVNHVDLSIPKGSIYSIIGPNGAGKTTFFNCLSGFYTPELGKILFCDQTIQGFSTEEVAKLGISRTYQNIRLFSQLTVIENVLIGQHTKLKTTWIDSVFRSPRYRQENKVAICEAKQLLKYVGLGGYSDTLACNLPYGLQRRLEIARALGNSPKLLLLDEPTAGMNPQETVEMIRLIRSLRDDLGISIILIEHDMNVVMGMSDRIGVLDYGTKIAEGAPKEIQANKRVIEAYLGPGGTALAKKYQQRRLQHAYC